VQESLSCYRASRGGLTRGARGIAENLPTIAFQT